MDRTNNWLFIIVWNILCNLHFYVGYLSRGFLMAFQKPPVDSRNIFTTGVVQQACAAGTIKTTAEVLEWTKVTSMAYDRYLNSNGVAVQEAAFNIIVGYLNGLTDIRNLLGDPTANIEPFQNRHSNEIRVFYNNQLLANLYNQTYLMTKERLLK